VLHVIIAGVVVVDAVFGGFSFVGVKGNAEFIFEISALFYLAAAFSCGAAG